MSFSIRKKLNYFKSSYWPEECLFLYIRSWIISSLLIDLENIVFYMYEAELFEVFLLTWRMSFCICTKLWTLAERLECLPMARETWVWSQVESYQRLKKMVLDSSFLNTQHYKYGSRVKWSNPGKGVAPSPTPWCRKLSKIEPSGHPRVWSPTLLICKKLYYFKSSYWPGEYLFLYVRSWIISSLLIDLENVFFSM